MNTIHLNQIGDKVIVKKGEGGGGSGGGDSYLYCDFKNILLNYKHYWRYATLVRTEIEGSVYITSPVDVLEGEVEDFVTAICVDPNLKIILPEEGEITVKDMFDSEFFEESGRIITKEEFYAL